MALADHGEKRVKTSAGVHAQLTITSSKKVTPREGSSTLVYRARRSRRLLGHRVHASSILIVPQDKEPRMSPRIARRCKPAMKLVFFPQTHRRCGM